MDSRILVIVLICTAAVFLAGCTAQNPPPAPTTVPAVTTVPALTTIPVLTVTATPQVPAEECVSDSDCIPAECCHPTGCIAGPRQKPCTMLCTMVCSGPLDCGAGRCGCEQGKCSIVPVSPATHR